MQNFDVDWTVIVAHLLLMGAAYILALPIGLNREQHARSAGLRTFPLVAVATCGFMLIGIEAVPSAEAQARVLGGLITGMGFIGGGAILKDNNSVTGTATAASLWGTGAIGAAVAWQRFEIALVVTLLTWLTLQLVPSVKQAVRENGGGDDDADEA